LKENVIYKKSILLILHLKYSYP